jgi:transposase
MGRRWQRRAVTNEERQAVVRLAVRLAHVRTASARSVERARGVLATLDGQLVEEIAADQRLARTTGYLWRHRFEERGCAGVEERTRRGRPRPYPGALVGELVATALTTPKTVDVPFASWTLDRLVAYLSAHKGITMQRRRLGELLVSAGLRWRKQETCFGERVDPDCAAKRGPSHTSTRLLQRAVSSSVATSGVRKRRSACRATTASTLTT